MNAIRKLQEAYDARLPDDDDDGDREYVTEQVGKLLNCEDGDCVPFHDRKERPFIGPEFTVYGFAGFVPEPATLIENAERIATLIENAERMVRERRV